ncbi:uncharacterized protein LOC114523226 [Dendronephthya gigantea]|uniref:uncharacterized protein LOC114523226 n=1 Tax=Dendronephthya gigantea TaxID=151771 RepID=UPI00106D8110|nr:uncharacterized protein LOC114523226 [Dendronephthya gigantea]
MSDQTRSRWIVQIGWFFTLALYLTQTIIFTIIVAKHHDKGAFVACIILFSLVLVPLAAFFIRNWNSKYTGDDREIFCVWAIWATYIVAYVVTVAMIFCNVAGKLTKDDTLGINALKATLCITPALLILLLQLTICPSYRKPVLTLSIFAALNIFDGIEMLEIVLMQNEGYFTLNTATEKSIVAFACISFFLSPLGLVRNKFDGFGNIKEREKTSMILGPIEIIGTNLPFLVLRSVVWGKYKYEASVFIAKNIVSLVVGLVEFCILKKYIQWGE